MNIWSGFLCVILVAGSLAGPASAQSMFHFPQVWAGGPGTLTVANVDARAAEVDFELFGLDGVLPAMRSSGSATVWRRERSSQCLSIRCSPRRARGGGSGSAATCRGSLRNSFREMLSLILR